MSKPNCSPSPSHPTSSVSVPSHMEPAGVPPSQSLGLVLHQYSYPSLGQLSDRATKLGLAKGISIQVGAHAIASVLCFEAR